MNTLSVMALVNELGIKNIIYVCYELDDTDPRIFVYCIDGGLPCEIIFHVDGTNVSPRVVTPLFIKNEYKKDLEREEQIMILTAFDHDTFERLR